MGYISVPRFGEFCSCCCIPLLPELECKILTIWDWHFDPSLYSNLKLKRVLSFRCEITVETPTFITLDKTVNITVIGKIPLCCQLVRLKSLVNCLKLSSPANGAPDNWDRRLLPPRGPRPGPLHLARLQAGGAPPLDGQRETSKSALIFMATDISHAIPFIAGAVEVSAAFQDQP